MAETDGHADAYAEQRAKFHARTAARLVLACFTATLDVFESPGIAVADYVGSGRHGVM